MQGATQSLRSRAPHFPEWIFLWLCETSQFLGNKNSRFIIQIQIPAGSDQTPPDGVPKF